MLGFIRVPHLSSRRVHWHGCRRRNPLRFEELESRTLLTLYGPSQILHAYGFDKLPYDGSGQTIAIVDAYDNPNAVSDLATFDQLFGLPDPVFTIAQPQGKPNADLIWGMEIDLDVQWAHAVAPGADILLVEARTSNFSDMMAAVDYARQQPGVVAVSMSWGLGEYPFETFDDSHFSTPPGHIGGSGLPGGITFVAASGDTGGSVLWPSASPSVLSIGGTGLTLDDSNNIVSEVGWSGSGGGASEYETQPSFQVPFQGYGTRTTPDFSYNADLYSAYYVYDSYVFGGLIGVYGTSAGTPQWAGLIALADQALALNRIGSLDGPTQTIPALYHLANASYSTYYNDIVVGSNGYQAGPGYDLVTGIGSPIADQVVLGLVNGPVPPPPGGGRAAAPSADPFTRTEMSHRSVSPIHPSRIVPLSTSLPGHGGAVVGSTLAQQTGATDQTTAFALAALANPASELGPLLSAILSAPSKATPTAQDGSAAAALVEPAQASWRLPESPVESGGSTKAVRADDSHKSDAADRADSPVSDSASGVAWVPAIVDSNQRSAAAAYGRQ